MNRWMEVSACFAILALAVAVRLPGDPPAVLWLDEAWRVRQSLHGVAQGVLLLSEHLFVQLGYRLFGLHEAAFRIWPILGVLLAIVSVARLRGLLFRTPLWLWACLTYALAENFGMHTREFKPYGMDLGLTMATVASLLAAARTGNRSLSWFTLVSSLTAAGSAVFPFLHAGSSVFLLTRRRFPRPELAKAIVVPLVVFCVVYFGFLGGQAGTDATTKYWSALYVNNLQSARHAADVAWITGTSYSLNGSLVLWSCAFILAPLASLWRRDGFWALLLCPFVAQLAFSMLERYPLFDRPSFYFYGLAVLSVSYVADVLLSAVRNETKRLVSAWIVLVIAVSWLFASGGAERHWDNARRWPLRPDARSVFDRLAREYDGAAPLFLNDGIAHTYALYAPVVFPADSALNRQPVDWNNAIRDRNLTELCLHLMLRCGNLEAGQTAWFASAHTGYASRYYQELLRRVGDVEILVNERAACLVRVRFTRALRTLQPLCQQMWDNRAVK